MNIITAIFIGLIIGWLIEWVIDWFYWRRRYAEQQQALDEKEQALQSARAAEAQARERANALEEQLRAVNVLPASLEPPTIANRPDDLTKIKGIGPVIAKKLNEAGIMTYQQLGRLSTAEFEDLMGDLMQRFIDEKSILKQAQSLSEKNPL